jgi:hypothetical protein
MNPGPSACQSSPAPHIPTPISAGTASRRSRVRRDNPIADSPAVSRSRPRTPTPVAPGGNPLTRTPTPTPMTVTTAMGASHPSMSWPGMGHRRRGTAPLAVLSAGRWTRRPTAPTRSSPSAAVAFLASWASWLPGTGLTFATAARPVPNQNIHIPPTTQINDRSALEMIASCIRECAIKSTAPRHRRPLALEPTGRGCRPTSGDHAAIAHCWAAIAWPEFSAPAYGSGPGPASEGRGQHGSRPQCYEFAARLDCLDRKEL